MCVCLLIQRCGHYSTHACMRKCPRCRQRRRNVKDFRLRRSWRRRLVYPFRTLRLIHQNSDITPPKVIITIIHTPPLARSFNASVLTQDAYRDDAKHELCYKKHTHDSPAAIVAHRKTRAKRSEFISPEPRGRVGQHNKHKMGALTYFDQQSAKALAGATGPCGRGHATPERISFVGETRETSARMRLAGYQKQQHDRAR